jgi:hypothetical protein
MTVHGQFIAGVAPSLTAPVFFRLALHCWRSRFLDLEPVLDSSTTMASPSENTEAERRACEIRLRAERKAGDLRRNEDKAKGRHPPPSGGGGLRRTLSVARNWAFHKNRMNNLSARKGRFAVSTLMA